MSAPFAAAGSSPASGTPERIGGRAGMVRYVRIGRQAIYDARRTLVAYELLFRPTTVRSMTRSPGSRPPPR